MMVYAPMNRIEITKKCLTSIFDQNIKDILVIVVDDGSTDCTKEKNK